MADSRMSAMGPINFGKEYDPAKMRALERGLMSLYDAVRRLERAMIGGEPGQVLTKAGPKDFQAAWDAAGGSSGAVLDAVALLMVASQSFPNGLILKQGNGITFTVANGELTITAATFADIQPGTLLGRYGSQGQPVQITIGSNLNMSNTGVLSAVGGNGYPEVLGHLGI